MIYILQPFEYFHQNKHVPNGKKMYIWEISPRAENDLSNCFFLVLQLNFFLRNLLLKFSNFLGVNR